MKAILHPKQHPRRGAEVVAGNVYQNPHGRPLYKIVLGIVDRMGNRPWNNVVMLHVNAQGDVIGSSNQPYNYVKDHHDLVGRVTEMPELDIEWTNETVADPS